MESLILLETGLYTDYPLPKLVQLVEIPGAILLRFVVVDLPLDAILLLVHFLLKPVELIDSPLILALELIAQSVFVLLFLELLFQFRYP